MPLDELQCLAGTLADRKGARHAEWIEAMQIATGRQHRGRSHHVATGCRSQEPTVESVQDGAQLTVVGELLIAVMQVAQQRERRIAGRQGGNAQGRFGRLALDDGMHRESQGADVDSGRGRHGVSHGTQKVGPLRLRSRAPHDVQSVGYQGVLEFQHLIGQLGDAGVGTSGKPTRFGGGQFESCRLRLNYIDQRLTQRVVVGCVGTPAFERFLQLDQPAVEARVGHGGVR